MLLKHYRIAKALIDNFEMYYISRERNTRADLLSKLASTKKLDTSRLSSRKHSKLPP